MPVTKQAKKRLRSNAKKSERNTAVLSKLKTLKKKLKAETDPAKSAKIANEITKNFAKAASKGIVPKKRASRVISRSAKRVNKTK